MHAQGGGCIALWVSAHARALLAHHNKKAGEEIPVVSKNQVKEYKDSFSNEKFDFRNNPNITFFVYVSNFTWPIKIQADVEVFKVLSEVVSCSNDNENSGAISRSHQAPRPDDGAIF
ncbi:Attractin, partial [Ophiophagus hannah]